MWLEIGAVAIIVLVTAGAFTVISESKNIYIGDTRNSQVYNYKLCPDTVKQIPEENQLILKNLEEAKEKDFKEAENCI